MVTVAASLSLKRHLVPTGARLRLAALIAVGAEPTRNVELVCETCESAGVGFEGALTVNAALLCAADPVWLLAVTWQV